MTIREEREQFAAQEDTGEPPVRHMSLTISPKGNVADRLAEQVGADPSCRLPAHRGRSARFIWYRDESHLTLIVGKQEKGHVDSALAVGLAERGDRGLRLILPEDWHEPTLHRWAWLRDDLPLDVWSHAVGVGEKSPGLVEHVRPTRAQTQEVVHGLERPQLHLGEKTIWVEELMRWAGEQPDLDASHRHGVRAWQCRGQRVLRIQHGGTGLAVVAGIDWGVTAPHETPIALQLSGPVTRQDLSQLQALVLVLRDTVVNDV